jgi:hypothetical protein
MACDVTDTYDSSDVLVFMVVLGLKLLPVHIGYAARSRTLLSHHIFDCL